MTTLEKCDCRDFKDAIEQGFISGVTLEKEGRSVTFYGLNDPNGEGEEDLLILFCPFCGHVAGDALELRGELWAN